MRGGGVCVCMWRGENLTIRKCSRNEEMGESGWRVAGEECFLGCVFFSSFCGRFVASDSAPGG